VNVTNLTKSELLVEKWYNCYCRNSTFIKDRQSASYHHYIWQLWI